MIRRFTMMLLLAGASVVLSRAAIVDGVRTVPEPEQMLGFAASETTDTNYFLYNIGAHQLFCAGNLFDGEASLGQEGLRVAFVPTGTSPGVYHFYNESDGWRQVFLNDGLDGHVFVFRDPSGTGYPNCLWSVAESGETTFRLYAAAQNPGWGGLPCYQEGRFLGLDAGSGGTALSACLDEDKDHYIDWTLLSAEGCQAWQEAMTAYARAQELLKAIRLAKQLEGVDVSGPESVYLNESASVAELDAAIDVVYETIRKSASASNAVDMDTKLVNPRFDGNDVTKGWEGDRFQTQGEGENAEQFDTTFDTHQTVKDLPAGVYCVGAGAFYLSNKLDLGDAYKGYQTASLATQRARLYVSQHEGDDVSELEIRSPFAAPGTSPTEGIREFDFTDAATGQPLWIPANQDAAEIYMHALGRYAHRLFVATDGSPLTIGVRDMEQFPGNYYYPMWPENSGVDHFHSWSVFDDFTLTYYGDSPEAYQLMVDEGRLNYGDGTFDADTLCTDSYVTAYREAWHGQKATNKAEADVALAAIAEAHTALRLNVMLWNTWSYNVRKSLSMKDNDAAKKHLGPEHYQEYLDYFVTHCSAIREAHSLTNDELLQQIFEVRDKHAYFFMIFIDSSGIVDVMDNSREAIDRDAYYTLDGRRLVSTPRRSGLYIHGGRKLLVK